MTLNAVQHPEVRLFRKPDFSPHCIAPEGSPANKAKDWRINNCQNLVSRVP